MTSAVMSSQSADEESSAGALSVDGINSDVNNEQRATLQPAVETWTAGYSVFSRKLKLSAVVKRSARDKATTYRKNIQSQATVKPAEKPADSYSYSESAVARFQQEHYLRVTSRITLIAQCTSRGKINRKTKQSTAIRDELSRESIAEF
ncbi:hypothetical protein F511_37839 [Dorcoceras hygrometricum]|uniref:Uncharacterized protein n=1 Tax=Dorcoceras hygrometricum TaxID=472368 RepID=A0A2Z7A5W2_9LAMI|nr:hypothetical protein F511_37839 [Dorcoceras hygrometricum]